MTKRILTLINRKISDSDKNWSFFQNEVQRSISQYADANIYMGELDELSYEISDSKLKIWSLDGGWSLADFDLVVFRFVREEWAAAGICASFLINQGIPYIDTKIKPAPKNKFAAQTIRLMNGIVSIPSFYAKSPTMRRVIVNDLLPISYPVIIKDNNGRKGRLNFKVDTREAALDIIEKNPEIDFIIQRFIPNEGDYRILVLGGVPKLAISRAPSGDSHLSNTSLGGVSSVVPLGQFSEQIMQDVIRSVQVEDLQVAGVDLMFDKHTNQHYILEVNPSPQLATGAVPDLKMKAYAEYLASRINT